MIITVASSFVVKTPEMPLDPKLMASCMYYVCDSQMPELGAVGSSLMSGSQMRDDLMDGEEEGLRYRFGRMAGVSGKSRVAVFAEGREGV
jgi:hypothetical protein